MSKPPGMYTESSDLDIARRISQMQSRLKEVTSERSKIDGKNPAARFHRLSRLSRLAATCLVVATTAVAGFATAGFVPVVAYVALGVTSGTFVLAQRRTRAERRDLDARINADRGLHEGAPVTKERRRTWITEETHRGQALDQLRTNILEERDYCVRELIGRQPDAWLAREVNYDPTSPITSVMAQELVEAVTERAEAKSVNAPTSTAVEPAELAQPRQRVAQEHSL